MEDIFIQFANAVALSMEVVAIFLIALGGLEALFRLITPMFNREKSEGSRRRAWFGFARWLVLGLEFTLAADIVRTAIAPTWDAIGQLAAIAVIRTFLNFFLERDLEEVARDEKAVPKERIPYERRSEIHAS